MRSNISQKFQQLIAYLELTPEEFAQKIDYSPKAIIDIMTGKALASYEIITRLVYILHVNPYWIFYDSDIIILTDDNYTKHTMNLSEIKENIQLSSMIYFISEQTVMSPEICKILRPYKTILERITSLIQDASQNRK